MRQSIAKSFDDQPKLTEVHMKHEFRNTAPLLRVVFAAAALSATLAIGKFVDFLAVSAPVFAGNNHLPTMSAESKPQIDVDAINTNSEGA